MKRRTVRKFTNKHLPINSGNVLLERRSKLPLSQQAQLVGDALKVSRLLELINDIEKRPEDVKNVDSAIVENGIQIITKLKKGEEYLRQHSTRLIHRPESIDTVTHIKRRTGLEISEKSGIVLAVLNELKMWPQSQSTLDSEKLEIVKHFLRDIHTAIMDQLDASDELDLDL